MRPTPSLALAVLALLALASLAWLKPAPSLTPADAARHEGHGVVVVAGQARDVVVQDGATRFELHGDGAFLPVRVAGAVALEEGTLLAATGSLARLAGRLTLFVASPNSLGAPGGALSDAAVPLARLAEEPSAWTGRLVTVAGTVAGETLRDGDGHRVRIEGPRLGDGERRLTGLLAYEPACLCYAFHPAWTP